jgi:hypothetical protein
MNYSTFKTKLLAIETGISITSPTSMTIKRAYWGVPDGSIVELPTVINSMSETDRILGFGSRDQMLRIVINAFVAKVQTENETSCDIATAFWFAMKDAFDGDHTITDTVSMATLRGAEPTVPVLLNYAGQAYIGINAYLDIQQAEAFSF